VGGIFGEYTIPINEISHLEITTPVGLDTNFRVLLTMNDGSHRKLVGSNIDYMELKSHIEAIVGNHPKGTI